MRTSLIRRLSLLEKTVERAAPAPAESIIPFLLGCLDAWGIVIGPDESMAEATAQAMGMDCDTLRELLRHRAAGEDITARLAELGRAREAGV